MTDLAHYVSGKRVPGKSGRFADVFDPATGVAEKRVPLASTEEVGEVVAAAKAAWPAWAKTPPLRRARILDRFKFLLAGERRQARRAHLVRARQDPRRRARRGHPRPRGRRVRRRHPAPPEGRGHRERRHQRRQPLAAPAARGRRRHHAVQLPGDGADVDVPGRAGLRQRLHPEAVRARPVGRRCCLAELPDRGRPARRRLQRRQRRQGGGRRPPRPTRTSRR